MSPAGADGLRLTAGLAGRRRLDLEAHLAVHGELPVAGRGPLTLVEEVERAGLTGRGGAAYPTARKLAAVARRRRSGTVVVGNGGEGEPMSRKDRLLLEAAPHLVLDGALAAARCVGAKEIVITLPERAERADASLRAALGERRDVDAVRLESVPRRYLAGEETALLHHLDGGPLKPVLTPPLPVERGFGGRPTLVQNVETLAHLALIARHGGAWFRSVGTADAPGTALVTLSGAVALPGVYEIATGTSATAVIEAAGGITEPPRALLVGGFFGVWIDGSHVGELTLDPVGLREHGAALGSGVIAVLGHSACPVAETSRVLTWLAAESAGQCGPCVNGLAAVADAFERLGTGRADDGVHARLLRWAGDIEGRGACHHPNGVMRLLRSTLRVFAHEVEDHHRNGPCDACDLPPILMTPLHAVAA